MRNIEISEATFRALQALAEPLVDTPETVIVRLLEFANGGASGGGGPVRFDTRWRQQEETTDLALPEKEPLGRINADDDDDDLDDWDDEDEPLSPEQLMAEAKSQVSYEQSLVQRAARLLGQGPGLGIPPPAPPPTQA